MKQQRRVAEKALLGLHKRSKAAARAGGGVEDGSKGVVDASGGAAPLTHGGPPGRGAVVLSAGDTTGGSGANPFLSAPSTEGDGVVVAGTGLRGPSGTVLAEDSAFQVRDLTHPVIQGA